MLDTRSLFVPSWRLALALMLLEGRAFRLGEEGERIGGLCSP